MQTITHNELKQILSARKGAEIVGLATRTDARARKTGNPFGSIFKRSIGSAFTGVAYAENVAKEAGEAFAAKPRKWGEEIVPSRVATHEGKLYLVTRSTRKIRKAAKKRIQFETVNGEPLSYSEVKPFLPEKAPSARQAEIGVKAENQVEQRDFAFDSIYRARIRGVTYRVIPG